MEYNNYYSTQSGHPPPPVANHQHGGPQMHQQPPQGTQMVHTMMPSQNIRQSMPTGHSNHQILQQQHLGHHPQQMPSQQHPNYHQIQPPHPHGPPGSHSGSPHPQQQPQPQQQQHHNHHPTLTGPSPQSALQPQQHHMNPQSPHHGGPPMHMQQPQQPQPQQLNQVVRPSLGPSNMNHPQPGMQQTPHHPQNFFSGGPIPQSNMHPYPQQNQHHPHQHHQQHHHQSPVIHHAPHPHMQQGFGRNSPYYQGMLQTEIRIMELNRKLQTRPISRLPVSPLPTHPFDESLWWERFAADFFDDDATLTIRVLEDKEIVYTIGRTLIPRFFRTYYDGGVSDLSINLRNPRETFLQNNIIALDCDQTLIVTTNNLRHSNQIPSAVVYTEGHLTVEFVSNNFDSLLVKSWKFFTKGCREYIDRSLLSTMGYPAVLSEPITRHGLTKSTISYLKMCMIIEPMQDLMSHYKQSNAVPRECLRRFLAEKFKFRPTDDNRVTQNKRRKRKPSAAPLSGATTNKRTKANVNNAMTNNSGLNNIMMSPSATPGFTLGSQDVMVVGEPSMMGGDFGDDNERLITRLENSQYEPTATTPSNAEESDSLNLIPAVNDNPLTNTNNIIESNMENHTLSPSLLQRQQQQPQQIQPAPQPAPQLPTSEQPHQQPQQAAPPPPPQPHQVQSSPTSLQSVSQPSQLEQSSPPQESQQRQQLDLEEQTQEELEQPDQTNQIISIEHPEIEQHDDIGLPDMKPAVEVVRDEVPLNKIEEDGLTGEDSKPSEVEEKPKVNSIVDTINDPNLMLGMNSVEQLGNHTNSIQPLNEESNSNSQLPCQTAPAAIKQQQPLDNGVA